MAITRSMSGATKKIEKVPKQKSKPKLKFCKNVPYTIDYEAFQVFMLKDVAKRYYEKHPLSRFIRYFIFCSINSFHILVLIRFFMFFSSKMSREATLAGHAEWTKMTDAEKNVWIEYTKRRHGEGVDVWDILMECNNAYNHCNSLSGKKDKVEGAAEEPMDAATNGGAQD